VSPTKRFAEVARETSRGSKPKTKGRTARATIHVATNTVGKAFHVAADAFASLFAPTTTPQQQHEINMTARKREAEAEDAIDFSNYTAELARQRQQDQEREFRRAKERERER
jgi:hypothetical protein